MSVRRLLLAGAGHAHVRVLRDWMARPLPGVALTVVSPQALVPYSGMLPGWIAGHYSWQEACIDAKALTQRAGAQWLQAEVAALDASNRCVTLNDGQVLPFDVLSLNVGGTLQPPATPPGTQLLPMRPLSGLHEVWPAWREARQQEAARDWHVAVAGGGAAGLEALLAARHWALQHAPQHRWRWTVVTRSSGVLPGFGAAAVYLMTRRLKAAGVVLEVDATDGPDSRGDVDLWLWATGVQSLGWLSGSGLALDRQGFVRVDPWLRSVSHPAVLAAGDAAAWAEPLPKSGVTAVRMGPLLSNNLRAALGAPHLPETPWRSYHPRRRQLALLSTGERHAVAAWGPLAWQGRWVWRWKDRLDRGFIARHTVRQGR